MNQMRARKKIRSPIYPSPPHQNIKIFIFISERFANIKMYNYYNIFSVLKNIWIDAFSLFGSISNSGVTWNFSRWELKFFQGVAVRHEAVFEVDYTAYSI